MNKTLRQDAESIIKTHASSGQKMAFLAGGKTVVHLSGNGLGGRNQEMALDAVDDLIKTDPTGTNVNDIAIALIG